MSVPVGLYLTNQYYPGHDPAAALREQLALVRAARDGGWAAVFAGHHYLGDDLAHFQPLPMLARAAAEAEGMRIGTGIWLLALHNPVDVAEQLATLDIIAGGQLTFGVGLGYRDVEYAAFGIGTSRIDRFEDNLSIVRRLWAGEAVDADLPWCRLRGARLSLLPVQTPGPPIWMAANSDSAVQRAARLADAWMVNPHATLDTISRQLELYRVARGGRPGPLPLMREVFCGPDRETALRRAEPFLAAKYKTYADWGQNKVMPDRDAFDAAYAQLADQRFIVGSPADCVAALRPWLELGVTELILRTHWAGMPIEHAVESIRLLSTEVLPSL
ncbi:LLM class flavin-dependent oxidoreductase [Granulicoccus sp. GXG6511]|uniref:LLM class flavin-dependent oxidoreductase n=1 Tax=Granulicoccus sp. GXG6511 TaxID=3381351 RepID=UPI003D7E6945